MCCFPLSTSKRKLFSSDHAVSSETSLQCAVCGSFHRRTTRLDKAIDLVDSICLHFLQQKFTLMTNRCFKPADHFKTPLTLPSSMETDKVSYQKWSFLLSESFHPCLLPLFLKVRVMFPSPKISLWKVTHFLWNTPHAILVKKWCHPTKLGVIFIFEPPEFPKSLPLVDGQIQPFPNQAGWWWSPYSAKAGDVRWWSFLSL